ncbi:MAG TPA: NUDIX domain-containing protein [Gammaproteobacteria bacterium]|nr:NUDIX domain-containing protein [Gammaproteobacteria bacterium]
MQNPRVGVGIIITSGQEILLAQRKNSHGEGTWTTAGGHLELYEDVLSAAVRETEEETGILLNTNNIRELGFTQDIFEQENKHYITCFLSCELDKTVVKPKIVEPDKFSSEWIWFNVRNLPTPVFIPVTNALKKFRDQLF